MAEESITKQVEACKRSSHLSDLNSDALNLILDHLEAKTAWMRSLLLVSKQFYDLVLPRLYHTISKFVYPSSQGPPAFDYTTLRMLDKNNKGLEHVKYLILTDGSKSSNATQCEDWPEVGLLIHLLARDTLERFRWRSSNPLPYPFYQVLYSQQQSLRHVELNCSNITIDEMFGPLSSPSCVLRGLKDLKTLRIMPNLGEPMPEIGIELFKQHDTIRVLRLDLLHMHPETGGGEISEALTSGGGMNKFFADLLPSSVHLKELNLKGVNLSSCHKGLLSALDLPKLACLSLVGCQNAEHFLTALAKGPKVQSMQLKNFVLYHAKYWGPEDATEDADEIDPLLAAVDLFLSSIPASLDILWICLRGYNKLPDVKGPMHHGATLRWLFIDVREQKGADRTRFYCLEEWRLLFIAPYRTTAYPGFCNYVRATACIDTLTHLGINNWPSIYSKTGWKSIKLSRNDCRPPLGALATDVMNLRRRESSTISADPDLSDNAIRPILSTNLRVVTFGLCEQIKTKQNWGYGLDLPLDFLKNRTISVGGQQSWTMLSVTRDTDLDCDLLGSEFDIDEMAGDIGKFEQEIDW
ncbi:MAG: hypothetical protein Q9168_003201 [Polycauliona sp. 1 TL-2023]